MGANFFQLLENQGATDTLDFMNQYWLNDDGTNQELWNVRRISITGTSC